MADQTIDGEKIDYAAGIPIGKPVRICPSCKTEPPAGSDFCPKCGASLSSVVVITQPAVTALGIFGLLALIAGLGIVIYYWQFFSVAVTTQPIEFMGQRIGGGEQVNNIGLMADRQNGMLFGFFVTVIGLVMLVSDAFLRKR